MNYRVIAFLLRLVKDMYLQTILSSMSSIVVVVQLFLKEIYIYSWIYTNDDNPPYFVSLRVPFQHEESECLNPMFFGNGPHNC